MMRNLHNTRRHPHTVVMWGVDVHWSGPDVTDYFYNILLDVGGFEPCGKHQPLLQLWFLGFGWGAGI